MLCMKQGCPSEATHALKVVVPDTTTDRTCAEVLFSETVLCARHIEDEQAARLFESAGEDLKALFRTSAAEGTAPDFDEAYCEGVPIDSPEHRAYLGLAPKPN